MCETHVNKLLRDLKEDIKNGKAYNVLEQRATRNIKIHSFPFVFILFYLVVQVQLSAFPPHL